MKNRVDGEGVTSKEGTGKRIVLTLDKLHTEKVIHSVPVGTSGRRDDITVPDDVPYTSLHRANISFRTRDPTSIRTTVVPRGRLIHPSFSVERR